MNSMKSSHPALRPIGLGECLLKASAAPLSSLSNSNIVPARHQDQIERVRRMLHEENVPFDCFIISVKASIAANGVESFWP